MKEVGAGAFSAFLTFIFMFGVACVANDRGVIEGKKLGKQSVYEEAAIAGRGVFGVNEYTGVTEFKFFPKEKGK